MLNLIFKKQFRQIIFMDLTLLSLPLEIFHAISKYCNLSSYSKLRMSCKALQELAKCPTLNYDSYKLSILDLGTPDNDKFQLHLESSMFLELDDLNDASFLFLAKHGHLFECIRLLSSRRSYKISSAAKLDAIKYSIKNKYNPELIIHLFYRSKSDSLCAIASFFHTFEPLKYASSNGHLDLLKILIDNGSDINASDDEGLQAIHYAASEGNNHCLIYILDKGANVNSANDDGWQAIHASTREGHLTSLEILLSYGADANSIERGGWYPVHFAADNGHSNCLELLISHGADANSITNSHTHINPNNEIVGRGSNPIHFAASNGHIECIQILLNNGALINAYDENGLQPCYYAACDRHIECLELMLKSGAQFQLYKA
jgi:hypothetical protein